MKDRVEMSDLNQRSRTSVSKLEPPRITRQTRIQLRPIAPELPITPADTDDEDDPSPRRATSSPLSPTPSESSSCSSSMSSPVSKKKYLRKEKIGQGYADYCTHPLYDFHSDSLVTCSAQGSVYRCIEVATGREVAAKVIMTHELSAAELEAIKREVKTIKRLHHRHLVQYIKATETRKKELRIYMEYVPGGSLSARLRQTDGTGLPLALVQTYTRQLCEALQYLHQNRIAHRDIKCANIFLTLHGHELKLGDFGAFKEIGSVSLVGGLKGTPHWMAPEVIREQQTSDDGWLKADIWSLGCAVIEMLTGHSPWQQYSNPLTAMYQIVSSNNTPTIPADATEETSSFLKRCLQRNPNDRATTTELLAHPFLRSSGEDCSAHHEREKTSDRAHHDVATNSMPTDNQPKPKSKTRTNETTAKTSTKKAEDDEETRQHQRSTQGDPGSRRKQAVATGAATLPTTAKPASTPTGMSKPSQIPRLHPIELIKSPSNQEKESPPSQDIRATTNRNGITRGVSAGTLGPLPRLPHDKSSSTAPTGGITITPVRLRRLSTAPASSTRDPETILNTAQDRFKLPPLSARPPSTTTLSHH